MRTIDLFKRKTGTGEMGVATEDQVSGRFEIPEKALKENPFQPVYAASRIKAGEDHGTLYIVVGDEPGRYRISLASISFQKINDRFLDEDEGAVKWVTFSGNASGFLTGLEKQEAIDVVKGIVNNLKVQ